MAEGTKWEQKQQVVVHQQLNENWKLHFKNELRYGKIASTLILYYNELGLSYGKKEDWEILPAYRQRCEDTISGWKSNGEILINFYKFWRWKGWRFSDRSRFQFILGEQQWYYRNKLDVEFLYENCNFPIFVVSNEVFFEKFFHRFYSFRPEIALILPLFYWEEHTVMIGIQQQYEKVGGSFKLDKNFLRTQLHFTF